MVIPRNFTNIAEIKFKNDGIFRKRTRQFFIRLQNTVTIVVKDQKRSFDENHPINEIKRFLWDFILRKISKKI